MSEQALSDLLGRSVEHVPDSRPPIADLIRQGHSAQARRRLRTVVGVAVAGLLVVGSIAASQLGGERSAPPADQPSGGGQSGLPTPPTGMKWVGVGRSVVAVPQAWPVVPGIYCQGPSEPFVTITQWHVNVGCPPYQGPGRGSPQDQLVIDIEGSASGEVIAQLEGSPGSSALTQRSIDASRTMLPSGWLAIPSGEPYGGAGAPTVTSEITALEDAGFHVVRKNAAPNGDWQQVTTDPEIGTPALRGSTVVVYDHGAVASSATLRGHLLWVGGPAPGTTAPHPGIIHVVNADDSIDQMVVAGDDGRWEIYLPPGTYRVLATSPGYGSTTGDFAACSADRAIAVDAGQTVAMDVFCQMG